MLTAFLQELSVVFYLLFVWTSMGVLFSNPGTPYSISLSIVKGFVAYYALFEIIYLPMLFSFAPFSALAYVWIFITLALVVLSMVLRKNVWRKAIPYCFGVFKNLNRTGILAYCAVLSVIFAAFYNAFYVYYDSFYYAGITSEPLYSDTLFLNDGYTGMPLDYLNLRYALNGYPITNAVICKIFSIHPVHLLQFSMPALIIIVAFLIFYRIAVLLFDNNVRKAHIFVIFICLLYIWGTSYSVAHFLIFRFSEGKTIGANILMPLIFLLFVTYAKKNDNTPIQSVINKNKRVNNGFWIWMAAYATICVAFSASAVFVALPAMGAYFIPYAVVVKKPKILMYLFISSLPLICAVCAEMLYGRGYLYTVAPVGGFA